MKVESAIAELCRALGTTAADTTFVPVRRQLLGSSFDPLRIELGAEDNGLATVTITTLAAQRDAAARASCSPLGLDCWCGSAAGQPCGDR